MSIVEENPLGWDDEPMPHLRNLDMPEQAPVVPQEPVNAFDQMSPKITAKPRKIINVFSPVKPGKVSEKDICHPLPNHTVTKEQINELIANLWVMAKEFEDDKVKLDILEGIRQNFGQLLTNTFGEEFTGFFKDVNSISQYLTGDKGQQLRIKYADDPNFSNETLSGMAAIRYVKSLTGGGRSTKVPLNDSGIILTLDSFTEEEMLELNFGLIHNNIELGRETRGAVFTGDDVHIVMVLVEFILAHVVETNVKEKINLLKYILVSDIPTLLTGALSAIYPNGYPIIHACVNKVKDACDYMITSKKRDNGDYEPDSMLDFNKMLWVKTDLFSMEDILHMSAGKNAHTLSDIKAYQNRRAETYRARYDNTSVLWEDDKSSISVAYRTPTLYDYGLMANEWIQNAKVMAERAINNSAESIDGDRIRVRNKLMGEYSVVTELVKHAAWIQYLITTEKVNGEEIPKTISDKSSVTKILANLSRQDGISEKLEVSLLKFKENNISSFTGINNFECPVCHTGQTDPNSPTPSLIPINMVGYFFSIITWRAQLLQM